MADQSPFSGLDANDLRVIELFHPYALKKMKHVHEIGMRFAHYTSADVAMRIFSTKQVWMRKSSCMNDFMEIEYGMDLLSRSYTANKERVVKLCDGLFPGFCQKLEERFNSWLPHFRVSTYIACISEHGSEETGEEEDKIGRLSMWRAYGGNNGVALVMNSGPFLRPTDALKAYSNPVAYLSDSAFQKEFDALLGGLEADKEFLKQLGEEAALYHLFETFRTAILCTKHPGFREEREWRVIHNDRYEKSERLIPAIESIRGTPQPIYKIPLQDVPEGGLFGIELPALIDRVIIGPTQYPSAIHEALSRLLEKAGMKDAGKRVVISDIPLRQFD